MLVAVPKGKEPHSPGQVARLLLHLSQRFTKPHSYIGYGEPLPDRGGDDDASDGKGQTLCRSDVRIEYCLSDV